MKTLSSFDRPMPLLLLGIVIGITARQAVAQAQTNQQQSPEVTAALKAVADARSACDSLKERLLAPVHDTAEYKQAMAALDAAQADLVREKAVVPYPQDDVTALAQTILVDENRLTELEQPALKASADWKAANAKLLEAIKQLQTANQSRQQQEATERLQQQQAAAQARQMAVPAPTQQGQRPAVADQIHQLQETIAGLMQQQRAAFQSRQGGAAQQQQQQAIADQIRQSQEAIGRLAQQAAAQNQQAAPGSPLLRNTQFPRPPQPNAGQFQSTPNNISAIQNLVFQSEQTIILSMQIGQLQQQSANLTVQLADLTRDYKAEIAASPPGSNPPDPQDLLPEIRNVTAQRTQVEDKVQPLIQQVRAISPEKADLLVNQGQGILEELTQLHQQQQNPGLPYIKSAAGAPLIHFSSKVSPQVQQYLQDNLDEAERMKDPAYAAKKAQAQAEADAAQAQQQQQQAEQAAEQAREDQQRQADEQAQQQQQQEADEQAQQQQQQQEQQRQAEEQQRQIDEQNRRAQEAAERAAGQ